MDVEVVKSVLFVYLMVWTLSRLFTLCCCYGSRTNERGGEERSGLRRNSKRVEERGADAGGLKRDHTHDRYTTHAHVQGAVGAVQVGGTGADGGRLQRRA